MTNIVNKLRKTSLNELRVRGSQALSAFAERQSWSRRARLMSDEEFTKLLDPKQVSRSTSFREHFRLSSKAPVLPSFVNPQKTVAELRLHWPNAEREILSQADRILEGHFDLLGFTDLYFGNPIDWHLEPVSARRAPLVHWSKLNYLDAEVAGDKKIIWELNRHQYFATLGQAYWLTDDERYAQCITAHLNSWMEQNPPKLGINWASSLEVAFRSISWLWAFNFLKQSDALDAETFLHCAKLLYLNAKHLETYLSTYFSPNTHLTGEALGLFYLGTMLPEFKEARRWRNAGLKILLDQLPKHVQKDGVYFEQSSYYHRYTTDFYIHLLVLLRANKEQVHDGLKSRFQLLLDHLMYITRPDGLTPIFGDDDGGRLVKFDRRAANDFRATLSTGAVLFDRSDYKFVSGEPSEETLWLLGPEALKQLDSLNATEPALQSVAFETGGFYVMRDGWTPTSNYLLFDAGPHGMNNCGHAHADALAVELAAHGRAFLVDPGTYTYTGTKEMRDWFRGSSAHNTMTIDNEPSSLPAGPFSWQSIARTKRESWISQQQFDYVVASTEGFDRLTPPLTHTRSVFFLKNHYWVMRDYVASGEQHDLKLWFHLDADAAPLHGKGPEVEILAGDGQSERLQIAAFGRGGHWTTESGWVSSCYGQRKEAAVRAFSVKTFGWEGVVTFLLPFVNSVEPRPVVRQIEAIKGLGFEIEFDGKYEVLMFRGMPAASGGRVETSRLASDFDLTWVRFGEQRARIPDEMILIGGQRLELEGREILKSKRRISYLMASRMGDQFRVETEEGVLDLTLPISDLESLFTYSDGESSI